MKPSHQIRFPENAQPRCSVGGVISGTRAGAPAFTIGDSDAICTIEPTFDAYSLIAAAGAKRSWDCAGYEAARIEAARVTANMLSVIHGNPNSS